jgi:hypothetical protein
MDRINNPYSPGAGTPPPELSGRDEILEDAKVAFARIKAGRAEKLAEIGSRVLKSFSISMKVAETDVTLGMDTEAGFADSGDLQRGVTDAKKRYLRGLAELGPGEHQAGEIAAVFKKKATNFGSARDMLIKKGMIYAPRHGCLEFTVPLFDDFMRHHIPKIEDV